MPKGSIPILLLILLALPVKSQLFINEFQASNISTLIDPGVNYSQWIEIYNGGDHTIDLYGYYLSDQTDDPQRFRISESITVGSKKSALLWLDPNNKDYGSLTLDMDGGELLMANPTGQVIDRVSYSSQYIDISCGRKTDGAADWCFFKDPTPAKANNTEGYPQGIFPDSLVFSLPGGLYAGPQVLSLSTLTSSGEIRFTTDGSWPGQSSHLYHSPLNITSSMVVRARVYDDEKLPGEVRTNTYFLNEESTIPIVSISTDPDNFFGDDRGIYVEGDNGITGLCSDLPVNWNRDWERPINIEYFTSDGVQVINQVAGTKIFGGCSRSKSFKSLALYARKRYGDNSFSYPFFSTKGIEEFKGLVLRNSGNDSYYSLLRDGFMQTLVVGKMDIDYLAYQPANIFINGEYWGILNVREKINEHYVASNYSTDPDEIDMLEKEQYFNWGEVISGSGEFYDDLFDYLEQNDLSDDAHFEHVSTLMDVEEFLNYYLVQIYFQNEDWPQNNIKYWRYHGEGGKWRWILFDTDVGWGMNPHTGNALEWATRGASADYLIRALLQNDNFKNEFIQRMAGFINTIFHPDIVAPILDSIVGLVKGEIPRHAERWGLPTLGGFEYQTTGLMPLFTETRPDSMRLFMRNKFGIPGMEALSVGVNDPWKGEIYAAGVKLPDQHYGLYFRSVPVHIEAFPKPGYSFSHWEGSSGSSSPSIYLDFESAESLVATFQPAALRENIYINEVNASNHTSAADEYDQYDDWVEIYNDNDFDVDLAGMFLSDSEEDPEMYMLPFGCPERTTIGAKDYLLIWCDGESAQGALHTNFKLSKEGESVFLAQKRGNALSLVDSVDYAAQYTGITYGRNPETERWDFLMPTPGKMNSLMPGITLRINEFSTRNYGAWLDEFSEADDWIELYNPTDDTVDLAGLFLTDTLEDPLKHQIPKGHKETIMAPKAYKVLWADGQEEQGVLHLGFKLDSRSEQIGLYQVGAGFIDSLSYKNKYPDPIGRLPDGSSNIQYVSASPGLANGIDHKKGLFINEFLTRNTTAAKDGFGELDDWIEIYNGNDYPVDLGGIFLTDSLEDPTKYRIPTGMPDSTTIPANGYLLLWADGQEEQGVLHLGFKLDSRFEQIGLYQLGAGVIDSLSYLVEHPEIPTGRLPDGSSNIQYLSASPGAGNGFDRMDGLLINEFVADNRTTAADEYGEFDDWIEIYNGNDYPVDLGGIFLSDSLEDPMKHRIPMNKSDSTTIPARGHLVLWADGQVEQGALHLGFKLDSKSEQVGLYHLGEGVIDSLSYLIDHPDVPLGRFPDGNNELQYVSATPGEINRVRLLEGIYINEFMASNRTTLADEYGEFDDWIEIYNGNDYPLDLGGCFLTDSLGMPAKYRIPTGIKDSTTIPAHGYLIFWADHQKQQGVRHLDFSLSAEGEQIGLVQADGKQFIHTLNYASRGPDQAMGILGTKPGFFQIVSASPGFPNYLEPSEKLYISEILASGNEDHPDQHGEYDDWIEIYNDNDFEVDLGGFYLTDNKDQLQNFRIPSYSPDSTTIEAKGYLVMWADNQPEQGVTHLGFRLNADGEYLGLTGIDGVEVIDSLTFPSQFKNASYSREDNLGEWKYYPPTFRAKNTVALPSGLFINEIMASNTSIPDETGEFDDWIEIYNANTYAIDVGGLYLTDSIGELTKYRIPSHTPSLTTIGPKAYLVLIADEQKDQGIHHLNFKLKREGEQIALIHFDGRTILDSLSYPKQYKNSSYSRGQSDGVWVSIPPSPGAGNIGPDLSKLVINEVMGYNRTVIGDDHGEYDSWMELYNKGATPIDIGGLYFTDSMANPYKFRVSSEYPDSTRIDPYDFLTLWADNTEDQGVRHLGFKIAKTGEEIGLFDYWGRLVDSISYPFISPNISWGRSPDGYDVWTRFEQPTPSRSNMFTFIPRGKMDRGGLRIYPNPVLESAIIEIPLDKPGKIRFEIYDSHASFVSLLQFNGMGSGTEKFSWDVKDARGIRLTPGLYMFRAVSGEQNYTGKFVVN